MGRFRYLQNSMDSQADKPAAGDDRPAVAIVSNSQTPYRLHVLRRIVREIPQVRLWSVFTHDQADNPFSSAATQEIGAVHFGKGESAARQQGVKWQRWEWQKGGRIIEWIKANHIRAVMVQGYNDAGRVRIIRWCDRNGVPVFLFGDSNIHGDRATGAKAAVKRAVVGRIVRWCDGIMVCGRLGRAYYQKYGATADRLFDFPYEPDYGLIRNLPAETIAAVQRRFDLREGRRRVVFSGRLVQVKRADLLIEAFKVVANQRPEWDLVMVGDGELRDALKARVPAELKDRVIWTGFVDDQATVSAVYKCSDLLVLPSDYEPWALVINEAAAAGMAVIASSVVGAAAELVRDGVNGRLFPPGDQAALTTRLLDVTDPAKIDAARAASPAIVEDWQKRGDPVDGWRKALRSVGVLSADFKSSND